MITKYTEYIKEGYHINDKYNAVYKFICQYLNDNKVKHLFTLSEHDYKEDNIIALNLKYNEFVLLSLTSISNTLKLTLLLNKTIYYKDANEVIDVTKNYFDNFYDLLYKYYLEGLYHTKIKISNIPNINTEKYMDFLEKLYFNYKKDNIKAFKNYSDLLKDLENEFKTNIKMIPYKKEYYEQFNFVYNAKNFDLI